MSVSGSSGVGGLGWDAFELPDAPEAAEAAGSAAGEVAAERSAGAADPRAQALLARLEDVAESKQAWLPGWLKRFDTDGSIHQLAQRVLRDGEVTGDEVVKLVETAFDFDEMQTGEKQALVRLLNENAEAFQPPARQALADFLGVENPLPTRPVLEDGAWNCHLPSVAGQTYAIHPDGYPVGAGRGSEGPPGLHGEGAERIYRAGKALVEAPEGALRGLPAAVQERMLTNAAAQYERAFDEAAGAPVEPTDASKVRSGAVATLLALYEGGATQAIRDEAADRLIAFGRKEPLPGLRANIYLNLERHEKHLSPAQRLEASKLRELVLPTKPPYDEWFKGGQETFEVAHYAHHECWEHATDPVTRYQGIGLEVTEEGTNDRGEKYWVLEGKVEGGEGQEQQTRIRLVQSHDDFCRDLDDPGIHCVLYSGHSNLGGNVSEAIRRGPEANGNKLLQFQLCRGQQNIFEVANKYPNAHLTTSHDPSYFANMMDLAIGTLKGVARRDSYTGIDQGTRMSYWAERTSNYIKPNELRRYEFVDADRDGQPEVGLDARDRFYDVLPQRPNALTSDLVAESTDTPAEDLDATAVMNGVNFARTLVTYHVEHGPGSSPLKAIEGDRIEAGGFFEGSEDPVRVTQTTGRDGEPVYNVAVNKAYAGQSAYAIGALIQYELTKHFAEQDGRFTADEKARALVMTGEYLSYMYCSSRESDAIMRGVGRIAGVDDLGFRTVYDAIDSDHHGYATDKQVRALRERVRIR